MAKHAAPKPTTRHIPYAGIIAAVVACLVLAALLFLHPWEGLLGNDPSSDKDFESSTQPTTEDASSQQLAESTEESTPPEGIAASEPDPASLAGMLAAGSVTSIRVIGDSITAGYLTDGYGEIPDTPTIVYAGSEGVYHETAPEVRCWTNDFRSYATDHGVTSFVNAGICGFRMQYLAEEPDAWLGGDTDVIVVMLGSNDAAKESVEDFRSFAETALTAAEGHCAHLVVVSPPDNDRTDAVNLYGMDQIDSVLAELSAAHGWEHVSLLDVLQIVSDDLNPDQAHPTTSGSDKLWEAFHDRLGLA